MQPILLLHGALGSKQQMESLAELLGEAHYFNFSGHGGAPFDDAPLSIPALSSAIKTFMDDNDIDSAHIFGYSMGGYAAMYLAKQEPARVQSVVTLATKFHWNAEVASKELNMLNVEKIREKLPAFAAQLQQRHLPNDWTQVVESVKQLMQGLGENNALSLEDYGAIDTKILLLLGDRDKMVTLEETVAVYRKLPNAQLGVLPNTAHAFEQVHLPNLAYMIQRFTNPTQHPGGPTLA